MIRPVKKSFIYASNPAVAYNEAMRNYLVYLEKNQTTDSHTDMRWQRDQAWKENWGKEEQIRELKRTLKILRSQLKKMFKN